MKWYLFCATLGPIGYLSAPGTMATLVTLPLVYFFHMLLANQYIYAAVIVLITVISLWIVRNALSVLGRSDDPSEIVIDELVGCLLTFCGVTLSIKTLVAGFLLFRFFDIFKFGGVHYFERLNGEWGIMLDDVFAAFLSMIILRIIF